MIEPKIFEESSEDEDWIRAMNEELDQIEKNNTWELAPRTADKNVIGSKCVFENKIKSKDKLRKIKLDWSVKGMPKLRDNILMKILHQ